MITLYKKEPFLKKLSRKAGVPLMLGMTAFVSSMFYGIHDGQTMRTTPEVEAPIYAPRNIADQTQLNAKKSTFPLPRIKPDLVTQKLAELSPAERKSNFIEFMLPMIEETNEEILKRHEKVVAISNKSDWTEEDQKFISDMMARYKIEDDDIETLIARIQPIPTSLALAQSAVESGWGTSRLSRKGNVLFGQKTWKDDNAIAALGDGTLYAAFGHPKDSIRAYARNLNSHPAYKSLRAARWWFVTEKGRMPNGLELAKFLTQYSIKGDEYAEQISMVIQQNDLTKYDNM